MPIKSATAVMESEILKCRDCGYEFGEDEAEICKQCHQHICPRCSVCGCPTSYWKTYSRIIK